ncbi:hypothetical protein B0H14DRAFT_2881118, partial [Mycena olivaceomarginata]
FRCVLGLGPRLCAPGLPSPPARASRPQRPALAVAAARPPPKEKKDEDDEEEDEAAAAASKGKTLQGVLRQYESLKRAKPRNYVNAGGESVIPFPMNPSFNPPPPISDAARKRIYADYMLDPETNNIRALSQRYHLVSSAMNKPLQTGFLWGMERLLGVKPSPKPDVDDRIDVHMADMLEQDENRDAARQRFQRQYWESIPDDGKEPLLPASLEHAKKIAERMAQEAHDHKSHATLMPRFKDTPTIKSPAAEGADRRARRAAADAFVTSGEDGWRAAERRQEGKARRFGGDGVEGAVEGRTAGERGKRATAKREEAREASRA